jgi:hypothetical protein
MLVGKPLEKFSLGRPREYNIKVDLMETNYEDGRWMKLAQDHVQWRALELAVCQVLLPQR